MSPRALPDLQLSWTGSDVVAWSWDGGVPSAFAPPSSSLYGAMLREWGWLPPGSWSTRVDVEAPGGTRDLPAIVLPALAVVGAGGEPRRNQALSASSRWVRGMVALARHITGHGHLRPLVTTSRGAEAAPPSTLATATLPPCNSASSLTIARPRPVPSNFRDRAPSI